ncbi:MAG TPA: HAMP domain-containing sensor histidine kinase, partial [Minicystis sp.]|nr:HAMP domain-containing sensor histidine kinase [Minicystis sp.]
PVIAWMLLAVGALAALAHWDEQRESAAALDDFAREQAMVATAVGSEVATRLAIARRDGLRLAALAPAGQSVAAVLSEGYTGFVVRKPGTPASPAPPQTLAVHVPAPEGQTVDLFVPAEELLEGAARLEQPHVQRLLLRAPDGAGFRASDGTLLRLDGLRAAAAAGTPTVWLDREHAAALGLSPRRAAAGLATGDAGPLGHWAVAVVGSAEHERDRELRARARLILSVVLAAAVAFGFGAFAVRKQRRELDLAREIAQRDADRERDARLATASRAAMLGTLAMGIAHEVGTPLGVIAGRAEQLAARSTGDERAARAVQAIAEQAERIRRVVRGFLDLARGDEPAFCEAAPADVLRQAVALVAHRFASADVAIDVRAEQGLPPIRCDTPMLEQAIVNLLLNACDASKAGDRVEASVAVEDGRVAFSVSDAGAGIAKDAAARATEPFFTTKPAGQGTGLGLAIASEIVKLHRGELVLEPAEPRGTRARISVPARAEAQDAA